MKIPIALSLLAAGLLSAQPPAPRPRFGPGQNGQHPRGLEERLTQNLGLSAEQQNKVHTILAESQLSQPTRQQMETLRQSLNDAIKAGDEVQIDKITQEMGAMHQQQTALHAKTSAKIYALLTPDQKTKVGANLEMLMGPPMGGPRARMQPPQQQQK